MRTIVILFIITAFGCDTPTTKGVIYPMRTDSTLSQKESVEESSQNRNITISKDIHMGHYFESMDSIISMLDTLLGISLNEYELVHANRWMLDSLIAQDYYYAQQAGVFISDQKQLAILHRGNTLRVPSPVELDSIRSLLQSITIDVNIPEFTLRIWSGDSLIHRCMVRVGKNERKYLALAGHEVSLRTPIGEGTIVRIERNPLYINPVDGHRYKATRRDDGLYTKLPRIPFLETEIDGIRSGALIHPTTNLSTLGRASSNGCVGMREADAWVVYYFAPLGTRVTFRYDISASDSLNAEQKNSNPYHLFED